MNNFFLLLLLSISNKTTFNFSNTTYKARCGLCRRSSRRSPAGPNRSSGPGMWAGRSTFQSSSRRFPPPTRRALRVQRAEPWYRPSRFLWVTLRFLLQTRGLCLLHVTRQVSWAAPAGRRGGFYTGGAAGCISWAPGGRDWPARSRKFLVWVSRNMSGHCAEGDRRSRHLSRRDNSWM